MGTEHTAAGTYVQISRDDLEAWLDTVGKWSRFGKTAGIYLIHLSERVAVKLSSTIGTQNDAMGRGQASMNLALVSRVTDNILNRKAMDQSHFNRTSGWVKTWKVGVKRMQDAYLASADFYEAIAVIQDRETYKRDLLSRIEKIEDWKQNRVLTNLHGRVSNNGVLVARDEEALSREEVEAEEAKNTPVITTESRLEVLRSLYVGARANQDQWTMEFTKSIADQLKLKRPLSPKQADIIKDKLTSYRILTPTGEPAATLF